MRPRLVLFPSPAYRLTALVLGAAALGGASVLSACAAGQSGGPESAVTASDAQAPTGGKAAESGHAAERGNAAEGNQATATGASQGSSDEGGTGAGAGAGANAPTSEPGGVTHLPSPAGDPAFGPHAVELGHALVSVRSPGPWTYAALPASAGPAPTHWSLVKTIWVGQSYLYRALPSADGKSVVTLSTQEGALRHYDLKTGRLLVRAPLPNFEEFESADFALVDGDPSQVVLQRPSGASLVDLTQTPVDFPPPTGALAAGDGVAAAGIGRLYGFNARRIEPQSGELSFLQFIDGPDGRLSSELALQLVCKERPDDWDLSPDGKTLAIQYYPSNETHLLDLENKLVRLRLPSPKWGGSVALSPDGTLLALGGEELQLYSLPTGTLVGTDSSYQNNIDDITFTPDGALLLASAYDGKARSYNLAGVSEKVAKALASQRQATAPAASVLPRPQLLKHSGSANVYALSLSEDGRLLITVSGDQSMKVWRR